MDTTSSIIVYTAAWAIKNTNMFAYPRGRQRLELVAVIICSVIMGVANIMMIIQSIEAIVTNSVSYINKILTMRETRFDSSVVSYSSVSLYDPNSNPGLSQKFLNFYESIERLSVLKAVRLTTLPIDINIDFSAETSDF